MSSTAAHGGSSKARTKRTKSQTSETAEETPPKKVRKVKAAPAPPPPPAPPPKRAEPAVLGSLPLYGEELPDGGYDNIPAAAKSACAELRDVFRKIHDLKEGSPENKNVIGGEKQKGLVLFASIRRLNRLSHLYCKDTREQTQEQKLEVDDLHLQLQNLKYEAMHLRREISNCLEFRSGHEDIDLVEEEEFYSQAPETISKPEVSRTNDHQRMLCRLEWELEQRKLLSQQQEVLEKQISLEDQVIKQSEEKLDGLQPALDTLQRASLPLQDMLGLPVDKMREEESLARLLPEPLYVLYVQARGYAQVEDKSLRVSLVGDSDEAKAFQGGSSPREDSDEESGESDNEGGKEETENENTQKKRPKRKSTSEPVDVSKAHPLFVKLTFKLKKVGNFELLLSYLPNFCAVCVLVTVATMEDHTHPGSAHLDKLNLLSSLFEGDTGRVSPNIVVSCNIRRHGGDVFSAAVKRYGFPYKWVQSLCGISGLTTGTGGEGGGGGGDGGEWGEGTMKLQVQTSVKTMAAVMTALRKRFKAQVNLAKQIGKLEEGQTGGEGIEDAAAAASPQSQLVRWKSVSYPEVQSLEFGSKVIFNLQDRTNVNRYYLATLQHGQEPFSVKMLCLVCLTTHYPTTPPSFAVRIQTSSKKKEFEPHDIHVKNLEAQVNLHFLRSAPKDPSGQSLLTRQVHRLQECLDQYVASTRGGSASSHNIRGKGRLVTFS